MAYVGSQEGSRRDRPRRLARLRFRLLLICTLVAVAAGAATWQLTAPRPAFERPPPDLVPGNVERGRTVFFAGGCASCHASPGQPDRLRLGGGFALASPYGTFRVPNISPDRQAGIGAWSVTDLANALLSGVSPDNAHYYPAFPYSSYTGMTLEDVRDLYAFLQSLEPVSERSKPHELALPFRIRRFVGFWKLLFFRPRHVEDARAGQPVSDRGRYLVEVLGHCAECHSTHNAFGAVKPSTRFAGGANVDGVGFVPNITPQRLASWSVEDIAEMLKSGKTPDHGQIGWSMADVVENTAELSQDDRLAIASYLKSLPPKDTPKP